MTLILSNITPNGDGTANFSWTGGRNVSSNITFYSGPTANGPWTVMPSFEFGISGTANNLTAPVGFGWFEVTDTYSATVITSAPVSAFITNGAPAALPVVERIAQQIGNRLSGIAIALGYNFNATEIDRPNRMFSIKSVRDKDLLVLQEDATPDEENSTEGNPRALCWDQPFSICCFVLASDKDTTAVDYYTNLFIADVIAAISLTPPGQSVPTGNWQQFGDAYGGPIAMDSHISDLGIITHPDGAFAGGIVEYTVKYRVAETSAYVAIP